MKRFGWLMAGALSLSLAAACGPADYDGTGGIPGAPDSLIDVDGTSPIDTTNYQWVDYDFLFSVFTDVLGMTIQGVTDDPENAPLDYIEARKFQIGASDYTGNLPDNANPGNVTAPGYKTLVFAGTSACGIAVEGNFASYFPNGVTDLDTIYLTLLSRYPTDGERAVHTQMFADMEQTWQDMLDYNQANPGVLDPADVTKYTDATSSTQQADNRKGAAVCATLITSMEFLTVN